MTKFAAEDFHGPLDFHLPADRYRVTSLGDNLRLQRLDDDGVAIDLAPPPDEALGVVDLDAGRYRVVADPGAAAFVWIEPADAEDEADVAIMLLEDE